MTADPPVRKDGKCARPGCRRKRASMPSTNYVARSHYETDPFCSSACCRTYYGVTDVAIESRKPTGRKRMRSRQRAKP